MASLRYIVPALAIASGASAQFFGSSNSACSASGTLTVTAQAQATQLASCQTYTGSILVANGTAENIDLSGIQRITGDLIVEGSGTMQSFSAGTLSVIGGLFSLTSLTALTTLNFPSLVRATDIYWNALPNLQTLSFAQGVQMLRSLDIENTGLTSLKGINLATVGSVVIVNNNFLQDVTMQLGNVSQSLLISNNGNKLNVAFPNLIWANNATIRGADSISVPSLQSVNGSFGMYSGTNEEFSAPNLTSVGTSLSFVSNANLNNISLPVLKNIAGALYIVNDTSLEKVNGFPALSTVGNVYGYGSFNEFDLPSLTVVTGAFTLNSTADISASCKTFQAQAGPSKTIRGKIYCPTTSPTSGGSGTSGGSSSETSKSSASDLLIPGATGILGVVAAIFGLL